MIISIQQLEHFPWIGFFNKMSQADCFVLLDHIQFKKNYFENRNRIKTKSGWAWINVPVLMRRRFGQRINEVEINDKTNWKRKYLKSIEQSYSKAPHYKEVVDFILPAFDVEVNKLCDLNLNLIHRIHKYLEVDTRLVLSSELKIEGLASSELLLEICKRLNADTYISGPDGRNYLNKDLFSATGIELTYHDFTHPEYPQLYGKFVSHLSVLDLIANTGKDSVEIVKNSYRIKHYL